MLSTLLLFDIDGTLIKGSRAGRVAYARTIQTGLGVSPRMSGLRTSGKTDIMILEELLNRHGLRGRRVDMNEVFAAYLRHLEEAFRLDPGEVCPGVRDLLHVLSGQAHLWLALGTGNLEQAAWMKLAVHGLDGYFAAGGFGSDAPERKAVIAAGIAKAQARYGTRFQRVVVIGDTPDDIECARVNAVHSIGVGTGPFGLGVLRRAGATLVFPDLSDTDAVIRALDELPSTDPLRPTGLKDFLHLDA